MLNLRKLRIPRSIVILALTLCCNLAYAVPINIDAVRSYPGTIYGMAYDGVTGTYYARQNPGYDSSELVEFADVNAFRAGTVTQTHNVQNYGTYFAVQDGKHFGRVDNNTNAVQRVDIATGAVEATSNVAGMGGRNAFDTFNWSGFSSMNFMQTTTGMYVLGGDSGSSGSGLVASIDDNLTTGTPISIPNRSGSFFGWGFGFAIEDQLFLGESHNSNNIVAQIDLGTGLLSTIDFTLDGVLGSRSYWANTVYDHLTDTLFLANHNDNTLYEVTGAAAQFGVTITSSVPEPETLGLMALGACFLMVRRRRTRA